MEPSSSPRRGRGRPRGSRNRVKLGSGAKISPEIADRWHRGDLSWKFDACQQEIDAQWRGCTARRFVLNCSRRLGKSYWLVGTGVQKGISQPDQYIRFAAPTAKQCKTIVLPLLRKILADCPDDLRPEFVHQDLVLYFRNGSEMHISGCDSGNAERLRGTEAHLALVDEAGSVDELEYLVQDILLPQTLTTDGRIILASTPPRSPEHSFVKKYITDARADGAYCHRTIYDNPRLKDHQVKEYMKESGGEGTSTWRREYLADIIVDEARAVLPEFTTRQDVIVADLPRPPYFDTYVSMDVGFLDLTVVLFGYWDFMYARLVVEDEVCLRKMTTQDLADAIRSKEAHLWPNAKPRKRISDTDLIVINDLTRLHGLQFSPTRKDAKEAQINQARLMMAGDPPRIIVNPRCRTLIAHCLGAVWNQARTEFERVGDDSLSGEVHHFDAVDALIYMVRGIDRAHNPYPNDIAALDPNTHFIFPGAAEHRDAGLMRRLFGGWIQQTRR